MPLVRVIRPVGWTLLALAVLLGAVGLSAGWREVWGAGAAVAAVVLLCVPFLVRREPLRIETAFGRRRVVRGQSVLGALRVTATGRSSSARIVLTAGTERIVVDVAPLAAGERTEEVFSVAAVRRGLLRIGPAGIVQGDPLGLFERIADRTDASTIIVHPRTVRLPLTSLGHRRDLDGRRTPDIVRDELEFHALAEYRHGDDLRSVHWRSSARTGSLLVRTYEQTRRSGVFIGLSAAPEDYADAEEFETALSAAVSIGIAALRDGAPVVVRTGDRRLPADDPVALLDAAAGVGAEPGVRIDDVGGRLAGQAAAASLFVLVAGSRTGDGAVRDALRRTPAGAQPLVVCASSGGDGMRAQRLAGVASVVVSDLADLPAAVGRALA